MNIDDRQPRTCLVIASLLITALVAIPSLAQITLVKDIQSGANGSTPSYTTVLGSRIIFGADDGIHGFEPWVSDGTEGGTKMLADIMLLESPSYCGTSSNPIAFVVVGGVAFFGATDGWDADNLRCNRPIFTTDGTPEGTLESTVLDAGSGGSFAGGEMGGALYLRAWDSEHGEEIWKMVPDSDENMIRDIVDGVGSSSPLGFSSVTLDAPLGERLFFSAFTPTEGWQPWISGGEPGDTMMLKFINSITWNATSGPFVEFQGKAWFAADDGVNGNELWVSDGTESGTTQFMDLNPGPAASSTPQNFTVIGDQMFFLATFESYVFQLWVTDGTVENTHMVFDPSSEPTPSDIHEPTALNGKFYFTATTNGNGRELWVSDGTAGGTMMVTDLYPGGDSSPTWLTAADGKLFFSAYTPGPYRELWVSNGTAEGTIMVEDLYPGGTYPDPHSSWPNQLVATSDTLFFSATNGTDGTELWKLPLTDFVTTPDTPSGDSSGPIETSFSYSTGGSISLEGADVQYVFDWDDGTEPEWLPVGATSADHSWSAPGTYNVTAQASSASETGIVSKLSAGFDVEINDDETIEAEDVDGPTTGWEGVSYEFTFGATSSKEHQMEYSINWGDGTSGTDWAVLSGDPPSVSASHAWSESGQKSVAFTVRCIDHPEFEDYSSTSIEISLEPEEEISTAVVTGPTTGIVGFTYGFTLSATSNLNHDLEYLIHWGDGTAEQWLPMGSGLTSIQLSHAWDHSEPEPFPVDAEVRCIAHQIGSPSSEGLTIEISDNPPGWIFGDGFESGNLEAW